MLARVRRIERLIAQAKTQVGVQEGIIAEAQARNEDPTAARHVLAAAQDEVDRHVAALEATRGVWERITAVRQRSAEDRRPGPGRPPRSG